MFTIGRLAKRFQLSRSTLLYYDSIGLLRPSARTGCHYRVYSKEDAERLEQICLYRHAGVSLADIRRILESPDNTLAGVLEARLDELNEDIKRLRRQQHVIIGLLKNNDLFQRINVISKETWVSLLKAAGFSEGDMRRWHAEFERVSPEKHQRFLEFLCISEEEIRNIRSWASSEFVPDRDSARSLLIKAELPATQDP